ncbi:MAG: transketolase family protein [Bacillota bacterium]|jgi:transketolase
MADKQATREAYGKALAELGKTNKDLVVLDADLSKSTKTAEFAKVFPERFINVGIAEQNMACVAAGLATAGKTVFCSSFAMFAAGRAFEQVRNSIAYAELPVTVAATHSGVTVGEDGATHQAVEDMAIMRSVPGMTVVVPCDGTEAGKAVTALADYDKPAYLRLGRLAVETVTAEETPFEIGKGVVLKNGKDAAVFACGLMVQEALKAADALQADGIDVAVVDMHTIKPLDEVLVVEMAGQCGAVVTAEEGTVMGGLGSAVAEVLAESCPVPMGRIGVQDSFGESGKPAELLKKYHLTSEDIAAKVKETILKK